MSPNTGGKGPNEGNKDIEQAEKLKNNKAQEENKFLKDFIEDQKRDINNGDSYASIVNDIFGNGDISSEIIQKIEEFKKSGESVILDSNGNNSNKYANITVNNKLLSNLKTVCLGDYIRLKNNKQLIKNKLSQEFDFNLGEIDKNLENKIDNLGFSSLDKLLKNKKDREQFISDILKDKTPDKKEFTLFDGINIPDEIKKKLDQCNQKIKEYQKNDNVTEFDKELDNEYKELKDIEQMYVDININSVSPANISRFIHALLDHDIISKSETDKFIELNTPHLSISEAKNKGILTKTELSSLKTYYLKFALEDKKLNQLLGDKLKNNIGNIPDELFDDFIIPTSFYTKSNSKLEEYTINHGFENIGKYFEEIITSSKESISEHYNEETFKSFINNKGKYSESSFSNSKKFQEGNFLIWTRRNEATKEDRIVYYLIKEIDYNQNKIILEDKGSYNKYNSTSSSLQELSFNEFFTSLDVLEKNHKKNKVDNFTSITDQDRKDMIKDGRIEEELTSFELKEDQLIEEERKKLYTEADEKLKNEGKTDDEIHDYKKNNADFLNKVSQIENQNLEYTKKKIEVANPEGSEYGMDIGTSFVTEGKDSCVYTISAINTRQPFIDNQVGYIELIPENNGTKQQISFTDFYKTFIDKKCKRQSNAKDYNDLYNDVKGGDNTWRNFSMKDGKIKKNEAKNDYNYNYLVANKGKEFFPGCDMLQVHEFQGDKAVISLGKLVQKSKKETDSGEDETIYSMGSQTHTVTIGALNTWIKKVNLEPHHKDEANDIKEDEIDTVDRKGKFSSRLFSRYSIGEMLAGGKLWLETFESYLKEGNEEHSAKLAEGFLKGALPKELQVSFQARLEAATRKRMDDQVDMLKNLDSGPATEMVYQWLLNRDTPEYKKEAAMIFMVKGYGTLYTKKALYKHKGKFLWYEAMGGTINDERYKKIKNRAADDDVPFTEEALLYDLIAYQCKDPNANIVRRGRLYKELEAILGGGKTDEIEKGKKDAGKKRNCKPRVDFAIGELEGGSYPNAMGAFEQIVNKGNGGDLTMLNKVPFVMMFSGISYSFDQDLIDQFKNNPGAGRLVMSTMFASNVSKMDLFNQTVLQLSQDLFGESAYKEAQKIFDDQKKSSSEVDKIKNATKFFDKYGDKLTKAMNFLNSGETGKGSEVENFILLKTRDENKHDEGYDIYKQYKDLFFALTQAEAKFDVPDYMMDAHYKGGMSGLNMYKVSSEVLKLNSSSAFAKGEVATMYWEEIQDGIEAIGQRKYSNNPKQNRKDQEYLLTDKIRQLLAGILLNQGGNTRQLEGIMNGPTSVFGSKFNKWGIQANDFTNNGITYDQILKQDDKISNALLKKYVTNILDGNDNSMVQLRVDTAKSVDDKLNNVNDEEELD